MTEWRTVKDAIQRPLPPGDMGPGAFVPAPEVVAWAQETIIDERGALHNPDHIHLLQARIGAVWTSAEAKVTGARIAGQAETPSPKGKGFVKPRQEFQLREWFCESPWDHLPDFVITLSSPYSASCDDVSWCALVEHELYHCGQAVDGMGNPRFNSQSGRPIFTIRPHDVEEFVGVVERYGAAAGAGETAALVQAGRQEPTVGRASIGAACGTCLRRVA